jgi:hypothetical protein
MLILKLNSKNDTPTRNVSVLKKDRVSTKRQYRQNKPGKFGADYASYKPNNLAVKNRKLRIVISKSGTKKSPLHGKGLKGGVDESTKHQR